MIQRTKAHSEGRQNGSIEKERSFEGPRERRTYESDRTSNAHARRRQLANLDNT